MSEQEKCPKCYKENIYHDGSFWNCPDCSHEWSESSLSVSSEETADTQIKDANGNVLKDGDAVTIVKDLKVKGASSSLKVGTKIKSIRLVNSSDGHNISCKVDGFGAMNLKSEFVKKS